MNCLTENEKILKTLTVETLRVYNFLLKHNPNDVELSTISEALHLKKPTILHHLDKLKRIGLIEQTAKGYKIKEVIQINIIKGYANRIKRLFTTWMPMAFLFTAFFFISLFLLENLEAKAIGVIFSLLGFFISVKEITKIFY